MRTEAEQITLTHDDIAGFYQYFLIPKGLKNLNGGRYGRGDEIIEWIEKNIICPDEGTAYKYRGFMDPSAPRLKKILEDPDFLVITNFAVDKLGYPERCPAPMGYPEVWKVSLFKRKEI